MPAISSEDAFLRKRAFQNISAQRTNELLLIGEDTVTLIHIAIVSSRNYHRWHQVELSSMFLCI